MSSQIMVGLISICQLGQRDLGVYGGGEVYTVSIVADVMNKFVSSIESVVQYKDTEKSERKMICKDTKLNYKILGSKIVLLEHVLVWTLDQMNQLPCARTA